MDQEIGSLLVVDDNEMNRDVLSRHLQRRGYSVTTAIDGAHSIELLQQQQFDAILLDIMMPGITGWSVLEWIRERYSPAQLPVIMATANDSSEDIVQALQLGANDYVTKPLDMKVVLARVGTHVALKRTTEALEHSNQQLTAVNNRMRQDLLAAAAIQQAQLPPKTLTFGGCEVARAYRPCDELAGDFLNVFPLTQQEIGFYLLDVSGHGVPAALMSVAVSRALQPILTDICIVSTPNRFSPEGDDVLQITPPSQVADRLNERFSSDPAIGQYVTLIYGILNTSSGQLRCTSAGHPPPILVRKNGDTTCVEVPPGFPIGLFQVHETVYEKYQETGLSLDPGDRVFFYSDGVSEAMNTNDEQFGEQRMLRSLAGGVDHPLEGCVDRLLAAVLDWTAPCLPSDDVSILAIELRI